jgi:ribosomal protein S18 acetylase RimI-like enzyme
VAEVVHAHEPPLLENARRLIEEYAASLDVDLEFQGIDDELAELPGDYVPPRGGLYLARDGDRILGCVALRPLEGAVAELKRLWVRPEARGSGAGRLLVARALDDARNAGYVRVRLDTLPDQRAAHALYRSFGFVEIEPYRHNPVDGTAYLELVL